MKAMKIMFVAIAIIAVIVGWILLSPLVFDKVVDEELDMNAQMETILQGSFIDADDFHQASGKVLIISADNKQVIRFEDFEVTNGPDLYVYLATDTEATDFVNLGRLKGNIGNQNYEIPEDSDMENYKFVLVWCRAFGVLFGSADLS